MSSRYLKDLEIRRSKIIHVYRNGDPYSRAIFVILRLPEQKQLDRIIKAIEEKVRLPQNKPIRKLFEMSGTIVEDAVQIEDGKYYVAASTENYFSTEYGHPANWVLVGPVRTSKYANVRFVSKKEEEGTLNTFSASNNVLAYSKTQNQSKKTGTRKESQSQKKSTGSKKHPSKNMFVSAHVDNIRDSSEPIRKQVVDNKTKETESGSMKLDHIESKETEVKDELLNVIKTEEPENVIEQTPESDDVGIACDVPDVEPQEIISDHQEDNTNITNEFSDEADLDIHENVSNVVDGNPDIDVHDEPQSKEIPYETDQDVIENTESNIHQNHQENADISSEELYNEAATKIQASFRGFQVRRDMDVSRSSDIPDDSINENLDVSENTNDFEADNNI